MKFFIAVAALFYVVGATVVEKVPDYYWRPYGEQLPRDALRVIKDCSAESIYIGQAFFTQGLLPSGMYGDSHEVVVSADNKVLRTNTDTMILCTPHPNLYSWVKTSVGDFDQLQKECELVRGGVETGFTMFIGRELVNGKYQVGKIYKYPERKLVLPIGDHEQLYSNYEVLTFNCKRATTC